MAELWNGGPESTLISADVLASSVVADARRVNYCLLRKTKYGILKCVKKVESHICDCWMLSASVLISSE